MKTNIYWIDLFCGAGGTSSGIHLSGKNVKVLACVNHDKNAIESHKLNHPDAHHFTEDIRDFSERNHISLGGLTPIIFGWMIGSKGTKL